MTIKNTRTPILYIILALTFCQISFGQKLRLDTAFYNREGEIVTKQSDYLTYEVRPLDRRKRLNGSTVRYTKSGRMTESTTYVKGEKTGIYYRFNPSEEVMMYGNFVKGVKNGFWVIMGSDNSILKMEEYDETGHMINSREGIQDMTDKGELQAGDTTEAIIPAEFIGGQDGWSLFLAGNLKYPLEAKRGGYQGDVYLSFVVLSDGRVVAPMVVASPHEYLSKEALRMLEISPEWFPAKMGEVAIDTQMTLRIVFRLK